MVDIMKINNTEYQKSSTDHLEFFNMSNRLILKYRMQAPKLASCDRPIRKSGPYPTLIKEGFGVVGRHTVGVPANYGIGPRCVTQVFVEQQRCRNL